MSLRPTHAPCRPPAAKKCDSFRLEILTTFFIGFLLFPGCTTTVYWAKPHAQPGDFERDREDCECLQVPLPFGGHTDITRCLQAKGWNELPAPTP